MQNCRDIVISEWLNAGESKLSGLEFGNELDHFIFFT